MIAAVVLSSAGIVVTAERYTCVSIHSIGPDPVLIRNATVIQSERVMNAENETISRHYLCQVLDMPIRISPHEGQVVSVQLLGPDNPEFFSTTWTGLGRPRESEPEDWNLNGIPSESDDYFAFMDDFNAGASDFNGDGATNSQDFFDFLSAYFAKQPIR